MLEMNSFRQVIDQLAPELLYLTFYFQGEPYLNPDFLDMVKYAISKKIYTATSTNAHYLNDENARRTVESGLDRLILHFECCFRVGREAFALQRLPVDQHARAGRSPKLIDESV